MHVPIRACADDGNHDHCGDSRPEGLSRFALDLAEGVVKHPFHGGSADGARSIETPAYAGRANCDGTAGAGQSRGTRCRGRRRIELDAKLGTTRAELDHVPVMNARCDLDALPVQEGALSALHVVDQQLAGMLRIGVDTRVLTYNEIFAVRIETHGGGLVAPCNDLPEVLGGKVVHLIGADARCVANENAMHDAAPFFDVCVGDYWHAICVI